MTLRRLPEHEDSFHYELAACRHPEHEPPTHVVLEPGRWEHCCPSCHRTLLFTVPPGPVCHGLKSAPPMASGHAGAVGGISAPLLTHLALEMASTHPSYREAF